MKNKGFTVLELLVVIGIITAMMTLFLVNFKDFDSKATLENETEKIVSILKEAQLYALTGQTFGGVRYNYGLQLNECVPGSCNFYLFKDNQSSGNKLYETGEELTGGQHILASKINITSVLPAIGGDELNIIFSSPLGEIYFNDEQDEDEAIIVLEQMDSGDQKVIRINRISGQINY